MNTLSQTIEQIYHDSFMKKELAPFFNAYQKLYDNRVEDDFVIVYCLQNFEELFLSFGLKRIRLCSGDSSVGDQVKNKMPLLACPLVRSSLGVLEKHPHMFQAAKLILVPTTCDWKVKLCDHLAGYEQLHILELPHTQEKEKSDRQWFSETRELVMRIEKITGKNFSTKRLKKALSSIHKAMSLAGKLENIQQRTDRQTAIIFPFVLGAYGVMDIEDWCKSVERLLIKLQDKKHKDCNNPKVLLCGSPCVFPNHKLPFLIKSSGGILVGDELCSSSRQFWDVPVLDEMNKKTMLKSIANRYYHPCICPTFTPNRNRMNRIIEKFKQSKADGIIYHTLKGCHPYDIERFAFEDMCKKKDLPFLCIETDDAKEDSLSLSNRIEAFIDSLEERFF